MKADYTPMRILFTPPAFISGRVPAYRASLNMEADHDPTGIIGNDESLRWQTNLVEP
jgi:hypothetical protein